MGKLSEHTQKMWEICDASYEFYKDKVTLNGSEQTKMVDDITKLGDLIEHVKKNHRGSKGALPLFQDLGRAQYNMRELQTSFGPI